MEYLNLSNKNEEKCNGFVSLFYINEDIKNPKVLVVNENGFMSFPCAISKENKDTEEILNNYFKIEFGLDLDDIERMLVNTGRVMIPKDELFETNKIEDNTRYKIYEASIIDYDQFFSHNKKKKEVFWLTKVEILKSNMREEMKEVLKQQFSITR